MKMKLTLYNPTYDLKGHSLFTCMYSIHFALHNKTHMKCVLSNQCFRNENAMGSTKVFYILNFTVPRFLK